jgi:scyllo-inositol 2-dehydrogenase (NADP+)
MPGTLYAVSMHEPIRAGVVGFGLAGRVFHTAIIQATPGLELGCVVQRSGDEAAREYPGIRIARSVEEMLGDVGIQLVVIATPSYSHFGLARQSLREQRHVVVDKPFTLTAAESAELIELARERKLLLAPFQNRRWDGDFQTVRDLIAGGELGRLVTYESHFDRFRPEPRRNVWRESGGAGSGLLYDLGPHLIDQALVLFGAPAQITADIRIDRENGAADDAFDLRLEYWDPHRVTVLLRSTFTACVPGPRFLLHGAQGSFVKWGLDPQEDQIKGGVAVGAPEFGFEDESRWGELTLASGEKRRIPTQRGDYREFYANIRDALLGKAELAVKPEHAWRTARIIELARESSGQGRSLKVDFSTQS